MNTTSSSHLPREVAYLSGNGNYTWVHYSDGGKVLRSFTIKRLMNGPYSSFIRIHKNFAINPDCVRVWMMVPTIRHNCVYLKTAEGVKPFEISKRRSKEIKQQLGLPLDKRIAYTQPRKRK